MRLRRILAQRLRALFQRARVDEELRRELALHLDQLTLEYRAAGMSQREFAKRLKRSNNFVWRIEAGERQVNVLEFFEIAKAAGLSPDVLTRRVMRSANVIPSAA